jgi:hypothetical protein
MLASLVDGLFEMGMMGRLKDLVALHIASSSGKRETRKLQMRCQARASQIVLSQ